MAKKILINKEQYQYDFIPGASVVEVILEGQSFKFSSKELALETDGKHFILNNRDYFVEKLSGRKIKTADEGGSISPMPGKILKVLVSEGSLVKKGDPLIIMEAMKMEHTLKASKDAKVILIKYKEGDLVDGQVELVELED
jgi:acetyl/propionyl-CoA carboxylase alpha subunit